VVAAELAEAVVRGLAVAEFREELDPAALAAAVV
jgi:hypothetical protein